MQTYVREHERHLAFEVHWLTYAAERFSKVSGRDKVVFQDSCFLHARNLLEFTGWGRPAHGWWAPDFGGSAPEPDEYGKQWLDLINSKATHLGQGRVKAKQPPWPVPEDDLRCVELARYLLRRLRSAAFGTELTILSARRIAELGLEHLAKPTRASLRALADLVD